MLCSILLTNLDVFVPKTYACYYSSDLLYMAILLYVYSLYCVIHTISLVYGTTTD